MPRSNNPVFSGVLAHWTYPDSILEFSATNIERGEELRSHVENLILSWQTRIMDATHSFRIEDGSVVRGKKVTINLDGESVAAFEGESVAAVMMVENKVAMRTTTENQPRGVFCGMGVCFDCLVVVDGVPNTRACMTWVKEGMQIKTQRGLSA
jgi:hypothetical protein